MTAPTTEHARELGPLAAAAPLEAIGRPQMSLSEHFRRDHFPAPPPPAALSIEGAVHTPLTLTLPDLAALAADEQRVVLECAGHRRTEHDPPPDGLPWALGAIGEATWTGVSLARVLALAAPSERARFVRLVGADAGEVARGGVEPYARTIPLEKACDEATLLAYAVGGEPISAKRGGPVRAIVPGWYATDSVKWLSRIELREEPGDGFFDAEDYRFHAPGDDGPGLRMSQLPVHALITGLQDGGTCIRGAAWGGCGGVARVDVSIDGEPWQAADLGHERGPWARRFWTFTWPATAGEHELAVRATDAAGDAQPAVAPPNVAGYANNSIHRVAVTVM